MSFEQNWYIIPYHIRKLPGMTLALLDFYETIFQFWNKGKACYLSNRAIMERTGIKSITTIHDAFRYFEGHGEMERVTENGQRFITKVMKIATESEGGGTSTVGGGGTSTVVGGGYQHSGTHNINNTNTKNLTKNSCPPEGEPDGFNEFWNAYPKKTGKKAAQKAWKKIEYKKYAEIVDDVNKRKDNNWKGKEKQHIPDPATYLNGERWTDEIYTNKESINGKSKSRVTKSFELLTEIHQRELENERAARNKNPTQDLDYDPLCPLSIHLA